MRCGHCEANPRGSRRDQLSRPLRSGWHPPQELPGIRSRVDHETTGSVMNAASSTDTGGRGLAEREFPGTHGAATAVGLMRADTSTALLRTIAEVLDIRAVFPRVSEIV